MYLIRSWRRVSTSSLVNSTGPPYSDPSLLVRSFTGNDGRILPLFVISPTIYYCCFSLKKLAEILLVPNYTLSEFVSFTPIISIKPAKKMIFIFFSEIFIFICLKWLNGYIKTKSKRTRESMVFFSILKTAKLLQREKIKQWFELNNKIVKHYQ